MTGSTVNVVGRCEGRTHTPFTGIPPELITGHRTRHHVELLRTTPKQLHFTRRVEGLSIPFHKRS